MSDLRELLARVQAATGPDRGIDVDVLTSIDGWRHIDGSMFYGPGEAVAHLCDGWFDPEVQELPFVTASLDAVTALIERVLLDASWDVYKVPSGLADASVYSPDEHAAQGHTPALALLAAFLSALIEKETRDAA
jgi:hypothetical protein